MKITGKTRLLGLIGTPVDHSKSPAMYNCDIVEMKPVIGEARQAPGNSMIATGDALNAALSI